MTKWEEKKQLAKKDNNVLLYNAMISYEKNGDVAVFIDAVEHLQTEINKMKFMIDNGLSWDDLKDGTIQTK